MANQAQLDDELVDQLLRTLLIEDAAFEVALDVDVEEGRGAAERGGRAIVFLGPGEIGHVKGLHRFLRSGRRTGNVHAVTRRHGFHLAEGANLLAQLFAQTNAFLGHWPSALRKSSCLASMRKSTP